MTGDPIEVGRRRHVGSQVDDQPLTVGAGSSSVSNASRSAPTSGCTTAVVPARPAATGRRSHGRCLTGVGKGPDRLPEHAARHSVVGHAQAAGRARLHGRPRITRRDFATLDDGLPGTHFVSLQRSIADFNATRAVMNAADAHSHDPRIDSRHHNGINAFLDVHSRATFAADAELDFRPAATNCGIEGDIAHATAIVEAQHLPTGDHTRHALLKNLYAVELVRDGHRWVMRRVHSDNFWYTCDPSVILGP